MGMAGILEAFSSKAAAFGNEQIDALRELAELAEAAYERECRAATGVPVKPTTRRQQLFAALTPKDKEIANEMFSDPSPGRRYWILGGAVIALLLISGVLWLTWHEPLPDTSDKTQTGKAVQTPAVAPPTIELAPKPQAGTGHRSSSKDEVLKNAAKIEPAEDEKSAIVLAASEPAVPKKRVQPDSAQGADEAPPAVDVSTSASSGTFSGFAAPATMPALAIKVSQGVTQGVLLHQVRPAYPPQARAQRIAGSVELDATIDEKGAVKAVKIVSGPPMLAGAARDAVRQWRYSPPLLNGTPIEIQKRITVVFKLP